jgi:hypothetical protein
MINTELQNIDELLNFLPKFSKTHNKYIYKSINGVGMEVNEYILPIPVYPMYVYDFFELASNEFWLDSNYLEKVSKEMLKDDNFISTASLDQVKSLLTYCCRGERFCTGFWYSILKTGRIKLILERLAKLRELIKVD